MLISLRSGAQQCSVQAPNRGRIQIINPVIEGISDKTCFTTLVRKQWAGINRSPLTGCFSFSLLLQNEFADVGLNIMSNCFFLEQRLAIYGNFICGMYLPEGVQMLLKKRADITNSRDFLTKHQLCAYVTYYDSCNVDAGLRLLLKFEFGAVYCQDNFYGELVSPLIVANFYNSLSGIGEMACVAGNPEVNNKLGAGLNTGSDRVILCSRNIFGIT